MGLCCQKSHKICDIKCGICGYVIKNGEYVLDCGHHFHTTCIFDHFYDHGKNHGYPHCPICGKIHLQTLKHVQHTQGLQEFLIKNNKNI